MSQKAMMLITSDWNNHKTFRMIPLSNDSVYIEGIYDVEAKTLALMSKQVAESYRMIPRLSVEGEIIPSKVKRTNGKDFKEERVVITSSIEYYITEAAEIEEIVKHMAVNESTFDFKKYMTSDASELVMKK